MVGNEAAMRKDSGVRAGQGQAEQGRAGQGRASDARQGERSVRIRSLLATSASYAWTQQARARAWVRGAPAAGTSLVPARYLPGTGIV